MRVDDYKNACRIAAEEISGKDPKCVATAAGAQWLEDEQCFLLTFFSRPVKVKAPDMEVSWGDAKEGEDFSLTDSVLVLHYLTGAKGAPATGDFVAYREIPGGEFYFKAFNGRAEIPLAKTFGNSPGLLTKAAEQMGGEPVKGYGDEGARFRVLPNIDILVAVHYADEEFDSAGTVLFDRVVGTCFSNEDISWLGSALVYRLMGKARSLA